MLIIITQESYIDVLWVYIGKSTKYSVRLHSNAQYKTLPFALRLIVIRDLSEYCILVDIQKPNTPYWIT